MKLQRVLGIVVILLSFSASITTAFSKENSRVEIEDIHKNSVNAVCSDGETMLGALFNDENVLVELKTAPIINGQASIDFNKNIDDYNLKLLSWDDNMKSETEPCIRRALNLQFKGEYAKEVDNGTAVYRVSDDETKPMTLVFNNDSTDISISFDIKVEDISVDGAIAGVTVFNDNICGCGVGFFRDDNDERYIPHMTLFETQPFELAEYSDFKNQWVHIELNYSNGAAYVTYTKPDEGTAYVNNQPVQISYGVGSVKPINKLSFGIAFRGTLSILPASTNFCLKNISIERG